MKPPRNWTAEAINDLFPGAAWTWQHGELIWLDPHTTAPSLEQIQAHVMHLQSQAQVPTHVTPLQIRRALRELDLMDQVESYVSTAPMTIQEAWEYAVQINRADPLVQAAADHLGLTSAQVDQLFIRAHAL
jgi:hypothetical protein